ncbi:MAG: RsmD family RNA methyltransferase [Holophagaceae bacterium]|nr:RsmD family RNA methyltransferase [Holophagaceae bacterium]
MRIISGSMKGRRLDGPAQGEMDVRPTSDKAREALFSILQAWPLGSFVDLFSGTGAVALEAYSRGYGPVACVEAKPRPFLLKNLSHGKVNLMSKDVSALRPETFTEVAVLFSDPPYERSQEFWTKLSARMVPWMAPGGVLVWETDERTELDAQPGWELIETRRYGTARFHFLENR